MSQRRLEKMSGLLKQTIAEILLYKSKDARLNAVSLTGVKVTADLKKATALYSLPPGHENEEDNIKKALAKAAPFVRSALSEELTLKYVPEIRFEFDRNQQYAAHINDVLRSLPELKPPEAQDDQEQEN